MYSYKTIAIKSIDKKYDSYLTYYLTKDKIILFDYFINDFKLGKKLFDYLKSLLEENHKGIVTFIQEDSNYSQTIKKYTFFSNPFNKGRLSERVPFVFYANDDELLKYHDSSNWLINPFDHDAL